MNVTRETCHSTENGTLSFRSSNHIQRIATGILIAWLMCSLFVVLFSLFYSKQVDIFEVWGNNVFQHAMQAQYENMPGLSSILRVISSVFFLASKVWFFIASFIVKAVNWVDQWIFELIEELITGNNKDNLLSPCATLITTIGIGGFALSAINEIRAKRHHGVPLSDVIDYFYPWHQSLLFIHIGFFFFGIISCEVGILNGAARCLLGVIVCSGYSFMITWRTSLSGTKDYPIVFDYIQRITKWSLNENLNKMTDSSVKDLISDISLYIGQEYLKSSSLRPVDMLKTLDSDIDILVQLVKVFFLKDDGETSFALDEKRLFREVIGINDNDATGSCLGRHVIFALRDGDNLIGGNFQRCIKDCELVWRNIFVAFDPDDRRIAEIAAVILTGTFLRCQKVFLALLCGFSSYRRSDISIANFDNLKWAKTYESIWRICDGLFNDMNKQYQFKSFRSFLGMVELGAMYWDAATDPNYSWSSHDQVLLLIKQIPDRKYIFLHMEELIGIYLACAYLISVDKPPSRSRLAKALPSMERLMRISLDEQTPLLHR